MFCFSPLLLSTKKVYDLDYKLYRWRLIQNKIRPYMTNNYDYMSYLPYDLVKFKNFSTLRCKNLVLNILNCTLLACKINSYTWIKICKPIMKLETFYVTKFEKFLDITRPLKIVNACYSASIIITFKNIKFLNILTESI